MNINSLIAGADCLLANDTASAPARFPAGDMAVEHLRVVSMNAMQQAGITASELDLIISYSMSQDHLAYDKDIYGPRICHPLQREINADGAFAFDLMDASATMAFDLASSMLLDMGLKFALVVRADVNHSMLPDAETGFDWTDGVAAAVVQAPDLVHSISLEEPIESAVAPCVLQLNPSLISADDPKGQIRFRPDDNFSTAYQQAELKLRQRLTKGGIPAARIFSESWFSASDGNATNSGPFGMYQVMQEKITHKDCLQWACIVFDPYRMKLSAHVSRVNSIPEV